MFLPQFAPYSKILSASFRYTNAYFGLSIPILIFAWLLSWWTVPTNFSITQACCTIVVNKLMKLKFSQRIIVET